MEKAEEYRSSVASGSSRKRLVFEILSRHSSFSSSLLISLHLGKSTTLKSKLEVCVQTSYDVEYFNVFAQTSE